LYDFALAFSFLLVAAVIPLLSGIADYSGNKKSFMKFFCYMGASACSALYFFDNSNTDTFYLPDLAFGHFVSYYYLDDVCLSEDSSLCFSDKAKCDFVLPSAFSPNGDNINDLYSPFPESVHMQVFRIYNRWGQKIYEVMDTNAAWDGKFNGEPQPSDVYAFYLEVKNEKTGKTEQRSGSFTLLR
jgi:gliding motility-associated-like protein